MDDIPVAGMGGYKINWDEIDEINPFGAEPQTVAPKQVKPPSTPVSAQGDCPDSTESPKRTPTKQPPPPPVRKDSTKVTASPKKDQNIQLSTDNCKQERLPLKEKRPELPHMPSVKCDDVDAVLPPEDKEDDSDRKENAASVTTFDKPKTPMLSKNSDESAINSINPPQEQPAPPEELSIDDASADVPKADTTVELEAVTTTQTALTGSTVTTGRVDSSTRPSSPANPHLLPGVDVSLHPPPDLTRIAPVGSSEIALSNHNSFGVVDQATQLRQERDALVQTVEDMKRCISEYERSLQHILDEKEHGKVDYNESIADVIAERDQAIEEVGTIERAFGDLHRRFEKSKSVIESYKQNEESLKRSIEEYKSLLQRQEQKYIALMKHAEDKLLKATQETEAAKKDSEASVARMEAALRLAELQVKGLETQLFQKTEENVELTKICDELLSKYGNTG